MSGQPADSNETSNSHLSPSLPRAIDHYNTYLSNRYFGSLDGIRFLCILAVLWHHAPILELVQEPVQLLKRGFLGVNFFFVLSGFLITTLLLREETEKGRFSLGGFYWRRICRILPVYLLVVSFAGFLNIVLLGRQEYLDILPYYYLFLSNFLVGDIPNLSPTWSLSVEEQYYALWPLLLLLVPRVYMKFALIGLIVLNLIIVLGFLSPIGVVLLDTDSLLIEITTTTYEPILMGSLCAILLNDKSSYTFCLRFLGGYFTPLATFALLVVLMQITPQNLEGLPFLIIHTAMCLCLISVVVRENHALKPFLTLRPIVRMGEISYGIYLYHLIALSIVNKAWNVLGLEIGVVYLLAYVGLTIIVCEISFRSFEAYFMKLKNRQPFARKSVRRI